MTIEIEIDREPKPGDVYAVDEHGRFVLQGRIGTLTTVPPDWSMVPPDLSTPPMPQGRVGGFYD